MEGRKKQGKRKEPKNAGIYSRCMLSQPVILNVKYIGKNLKSILERSVKSAIEGKCIVEGFVKTESFGTQVVDDQNYIYPRPEGYIVVPINRHQKALNPL